MIPQRYKQPCSMEFKASRSSGSRYISAIKWIVIHSAEHESARVIARYFASSTAKGSTHLVIDDKECYRTLADNMICWGAPGANTNGFHIEQCGYARWDTVIWKKHLETLRRTAYKTAIHCKKFGIPPVFIKAGDLKKGKKGITTHVECSKAFGGTHWDPGPGWPRWYFMRLVNTYYQELK